MFNFFSPYFWTRTKGAAAAAAFGILTEVFNDLWTMQHIQRPPGRGRAGGMVGWLAPLSPRPSSPQTGRIEGGGREGAKKVASCFHWLHSVYTNHCTLRSVQEFRSSARWMDYLEP